ncbi:hypothetical protein J1D01_03340 [Seonamhaeicola sp. NFXS20]|uniref:glycosyltransferase n=2 Tax=unclassified Seonamhaeicola TaxID=2622645 RepID=UPI003B8BFAE1
MVGIILIFYNNEKNLNLNVLTQVLNEASKLHFCLVNNGSSDKTLELLESIKYNCTNQINVLDVKKNKGELMALKSATRYLNSTLNLKFIGYVAIENLKGVDVLKKLLGLKPNFYNEINTSFLVKPKSNSVLVKNVFSIIDYLKKVLNDKKQ